MSNDTTTVVGVEQHESINEFAIAAEFGYLRFVGPFTVDKAGTRWSIMIPEDDITPGIGTLSAAVGEAAVLIADGRAVGGGISEEIDKPEGEGVIVAIVNQYARGGENPVQ